MLKLPSLSLSIASLLLLTPTASFAAPYKTQTNQVVITGLKPRVKYKINTTNLRDRNGIRTITTNGCGQALISQGTNYKQIIINNQTITPNTLPTQTHLRCSPRRNSSPKTPTNPAQQPFK